MKYIPVGNTGVHSSVLALGTMTFGESKAWSWAGVKQDEVNAIVKKAIDSGINLFDTADVYTEGESEKAVGKALKPYRDQILLSTKVRGRVGETVNEVGLSRHHMKIAIRKSLERLDTKWVDFYHLHAWDARVPLDETIETMQGLVDEGLVNYPSLSNFHAWQMADMQARCEERGYARYEFAQMSYSLLNREIENDVLPFLNYSGMSLLVWSPLHGGVLSGKYSKNEVPTGPDGTRMHGRKEFFPPFDQENGWKVVDKVVSIAKEQDATPSQVALAWLLQKKCVVIIGVKDMKQLDDDIGAMDVNLKQEQLKELDEVSKPKEPFLNWLIDWHNVRDRTFDIKE